MSGELLARLRPGYELLNQRRLDEWIEGLSPRIEANQFPAMPGTFRGRDGAREMMAELADAWEGSTGIRSRRETSARAATWSGSRAPAARAGSGWGRVIAHRLTIREGLTTRIEVFDHWEPGLAACGLG